MADAIDALGRALHYVGHNISRTELSVVVRKLDEGGFVIERKGSRVFHTQPAKSEQKEGPGHV